MCLILIIYICTLTVFELVPVGSDAGQCLVVALSPVCVCQSRGAFCTMDATNHQASSYVALTDRSSVVVEQSHFYASCARAEMVVNH